MKYVLELTRTEIEHILAAVCDDRDEGIYWGRKDQYIKRMDRIISKIEHALSGDTK